MFNFILDGGTVHRCIPVCTCHPSRVRSVPVAAAFPQHIQHVFRHNPVLGLSGPWPHVSRLLAGVFRHSDSIPLHFVFCPFERGITVPKDMSTGLSICLHLHCMIKTLCTSLRIFKPYRACRGNFPFFPGRQQMCQNATKPGPVTARPTTAADSPVLRVLLVACLRRLHVPLVCSSCVPWPGPTSIATSGCVTTTTLWSFRMSVPLQSFFAIHRQ